ncbi:1-aminocyclopropane-1-carboxylate deaminase/D-cysteine desulfhydrase [Actinomadura hibisca]|uniref:1-aminocyclopropane-1-carboxylate deaminase/D-cysteine desulfhydrase n=1 Tax=Actinomadura hibisca TaxID=68565 RepID=UPI000A94C0E6
MTELHDERLTRAGVRLFLKRDDLIHLDLPGNKWRKLKHNLRAAAEQSHHTLLTFGGAYSNHLRATAAAGRLFGFSTIGIVRGEEHLPLNEVLEFAATQGMKLAYLDRTTYRHKTDPAVIEALHQKWGDFYLLPEGGSNALAVQGCAELGAEIGPSYDVVCCAVGTGGTLAGLAAGLAPHQRALGFAALKGGEFLNDDVERLQRETYGERRGDWSIETAFHHGGYARRTPELDAFINDFATRHGITLDRIYVAKMLHGILTLAIQGTFPPGKRLLAVVTG